MSRIAAYELRLVEILHYGTKHIDLAARQEPRPEFTAQLLFQMFVGQPIVIGANCELQQQLRENEARDER